MYETRDEEAVKIGFVVSHYLSQNLSLLVFLLRRL